MIRISCTAKCTASEVAGAIRANYVISTAPDDHISKCWSFWIVESLIKVQLSGGTEAFEVAPVSSSSGLCSASDFQCNHEVGSARSTMLPFAHFPLTLQHHFDHSSLFHPNPTCSHLLALISYTPLLFPSTSFCLPKYFANILLTLVTLTTTSTHNQPSKGSSYIFQDTFSIGHPEFPQAFWLRLWFALFSLPQPGNFHHLPGFVSS